MGRPSKKDGSEKKPREVSATDAEWEAVRREAGKAGLSFSRFLLERLNRSRTVVSAEVTIHQVQTTMDIRDHLILIADRLAGLRSFPCAASARIILSNDRCDTARRSRVFSVSNSFSRLS